MQEVVRSGSVASSPPSAKDSSRPSARPMVLAPPPERLRPARGIVLALAGGAAMWAVFAAAWFLL